MAGLPPRLTVEDLRNWEKMCAIIADSKPWWEPGTKIGYHGHYLGVRRRRDHPPSHPETDPPGHFEEVTELLGVTNELLFAVPAAELRRVAGWRTLRAARRCSRTAEDFPILKLGLYLRRRMYNCLEVLGANILAGGTVTARAAGRRRALGEVDGVRLISPNGCAKHAVAMSGTDQIFGASPRRGGWATPLVSSCPTHTRRSASSGWGAWAGATPTPTLGPGPRSR